MMERIPGLIDRFSELKVLVVGDVMLDVYLDGVVERVCKEAPVAVVDVARQKRAPGGAANTAANLAALGAEAAVISVTGTDDEGHLLAEALSACGVATDHLFTDGRRATLVKSRITSSGQMIMRFDRGTTAPVRRGTEEALTRRLVEVLPAFDALVVSDYGYGVMTPAVIRRIGRPRPATAVTVVDSKRPDRYRSLGVTAARPGFDEALRLLGLPAEAGADAVCGRGEELLDLTGARIAAVTLDSKGALLFERGSEPYRTFADPFPSAWAAGAGDTFTAALALSLAAGAPAALACEVASAAAGVVVAKDGTTTCSAEELRDYFCLGGKCVGDMARLEERVRSYKRQGRRIVFMSGCFDVLDRDHISSLNYAKAMGDVLIVGIDADGPKGPEAPVNSLKDRVQVLTALSCVDNIFVLDRGTKDAIRVVRPDVIIKGGEA